MGNKTAYKEERQTEKKKKKMNKRERSKQIKKKGSPNFGLCPLTKNKKSV